MNDNAGEGPFERPEDNVRLYLTIAKLLMMTLGESAPPMPPVEHKAHLNHLHVQPEPYRKRLAALISCRDVPQYDQQVKALTARLPTTPLNVPNLDERTGAAFTIPVRGLQLNIPDAFLPRPTTFDDMTPWFYAYPFPTLIRSMQVSFPASAAHWSITPSPYQDPDRRIWKTYVWRKMPPPSDLETYYRFPQNSAPECSMIICVQPPWIISEADIESFKRTTEFPTFIEQENGNRPYKSAHRIWAKLWDLCAQAKCRFWVWTTYNRWIFGSFSKSFRAGHIFAIKPFNAHYPTIMQTLVFHTAKSMGLADGLYIPEYFDSTDDSDDPPDDLPQPPDYPGMYFPDSESEWEGMDEDIGISAGVSDYIDARLSAYGSAANVEQPVVRIFRDIYPNRRPPRAPPRRRRPTPPAAVAGPSWAGPSLFRARRASLINSRSSASPRASGSGTVANQNRGADGGEGSDTELNEEDDDGAPVEPVREYWGVSRAPAEVTESIVDWSDNIETDDTMVEELLQIDEEEEEGDEIEHGNEEEGEGEGEDPDATPDDIITHHLPIEQLYYSAIESINENGGDSLSVPAPSAVTYHPPQPSTYHRGGYMTVIPELGEIREQEETQALEEQQRRDVAVEARWRELQTVGVPMVEGAGTTGDVNGAVASSSGRDYHVIPSASRA